MSSSGDLTTKGIGRPLSLTSTTDLAHDAAADDDGNDDTSNLYNLTCLSHTVSNLLGFFAIGPDFPFLLEWCALHELMS